MPTLFRETTKMTISDGAEVALFGWWFLAAGGDVPITDAVEVLNSLTITHHWWANSGDTELYPAYSDQTEFAERYVELVDIDTGEILQRRFLNPPLVLAGSVGGGQLPAEVACCVSVRSGFSDRHGNGRFYLPGPASTALTATGDFSAAFQERCVDSMGNYFSNAGSADPALQVGTWSQATHAFTPATSINVGSIPDSQRRRRNKLVEVRFSYDVTP